MKKPEGPRWSAYCYGLFLRFALESRGWLEVLGGHFWFACPACPFCCGGLGRGSGLSRSRRQLRSLLTRLPQRDSVAGPGRKEISSPVCGGLLLLLLAELLGQKSRE